MSLVLDSSATLAWVYPDEITAAITEIRARVQSSGAVVPSLWRLEVANILEMNVRRGRHDASFRDATLADLSELPIRIDGETDRHAWNATLRLAAQHRLTLYDAAYLELAQRRGLTLATLDKDLRKAATTEGTALLPR